jgi:hypothetical protein
MIHLRTSHWPGTRVDHQAGGDTLPAWIAGLPVQRLAQSFEHETRPRALGLVLVLATERELQRARLRRTVRLGGLLMAAALALAIAGPRLLPASWLSIQPPAPLRETLSERLEPHAAAQAAPSRLPPARLHLDEGLRRPDDRGY